MPSWEERYSGFQSAAGQGARRVFVSIGRRPSLLSRVLLFLAIALFFGLALVILVPLMVIGLALMLVLWCHLQLKRLLSRARAPGGALDQRRNVRVIHRDR